MLINNKLKIARQHVGVNQTEAAESIGVTQRDISQLESGEKKFIPTEYIQYLNNKNIPLEMLFNDNISESIFKKELKNIGAKKYEVMKPSKTVVSERYNDIRKIPLLDVSIAAGLKGFINGSNVDIIDFISVPANMLKRNGEYVAGFARGESMSPTIFDSDIIVLRLLDKSEWAEMTDEHIYTIVDGDSSHLKRVKNRFEKGFVVCTSDNLDKVNYPNFTIYANEISNIFHADFKISAKMPNINASYYDRLKQLEDRFDEVESYLKKIK